MRADISFIVACCRWQPTPSRHRSRVPAYRADIAAAMMGKRINFSRQHYAINACRLRDMAFTAIAGAMRTACAAMLRAAGAMIASSRCFTMRAMRLLRPRFAGRKP